MSTKRLLLTAVVLVVGISLGAQFVGRVLYASWSIGWFGRDTLTGSWIGTMRAKRGAEFGFFLHLDYKAREGSYRRSHVSGKTANLEGRATICTPAGERYDYSVTGYASPFGTVEKLWVEYADPKLSALNLRLSGEWRPPALHLQSEANPFLPDGRFVPTRVLSSDDPDDSLAPFDLTRGTLEELDACRRGNAK
jgi:hypothetical protein